MILPAGCKKGDGTEEYNPDRVKIVEPEAVDLGLSVKWASFNLGASKPEGFGAYYARGETKPKWDYSEETYVGVSPEDGTTLDPEHDAAHVNLGGSWRMPTQNEMTELIYSCTWESKRIGGVIGLKVISRVEGYEDKWIFLPLAGCRVGTELMGRDSEGTVWFYDVGHGMDVSAGCFFLETQYLSAVPEYYGCSVRPVCP